MSDLPLNVVFVLGKPGSGKGTQCEKIIQTFSQCRHLSAGDLLREKRKENDSTSELIENCIREGKIVPVEITIQLLRNAMEKLQNGSVNERLLFLIDGFPRNQDNLDGWRGQMSGGVATVHNVLFFNISDEVATERCLARGASGSGRSDDNLESLKKRLNTYKDTQGVIDSYREEGLVTEFKGEETREAIFERVKETINSIVSKC